MPRTRSSTDHMLTFALSAPIADVRSARDILVAVLRQREQQAASLRERQQQKRKPVARKAATASVAAPKRRRARRKPVPQGLPETEQQYGAVE